MMPHQGVCIRAGDKFGFVRPDDGGSKDIFIGARWLAELDIHVGDRLEFTIDDYTKSKPFAKDVRKLSAAPDRKSIDYDKALNQVAADRSAKTSYRSSRQFKSDDN